VYSFSQCIDDVVAELIRPDLTPAMANYLNLTTREMHFTADTQPVPIAFKSNLQELAVIANVDNGFTWDITIPRLFQSMEAVYYANYGRYATERRPSSIRQFDGSVDGGQFGWYRSADTLAFVNYGGSGAEIDLAWTEFLPGLKYYESEERPAYWDEDAEDWVYQVVGSIDYGSTPVLQAKALALTTNWMIQRWRDVLLQGIRSKTWARLGDDVRMRTAYSAYQALRPALTNSETFDMSPRYRS
jgi:hypothetical protein